MENNLLYQIDRVLELFTMHMVKFKDNSEGVMVYNLDKDLAKKLVVYVFKNLNNDHSFYSNYNAIIDKLVEDGMLSKIPEEFIGGMYKRAEYNITFKGRFHFERGGYQGQTDRENSERTRVETLADNQKDNANRMTYLTAIVVAGVIVQSIYYFLELKKDGVSVLSIENFSQITVFLFGVIAGIIIYMLVLEGWNRRKQ